MDREPRSAEERYQALVERLAAEAGVVVPRDAPGAEGGFGAAGLKIDKKIFAMLAHGRLVVKLPRLRVDALVDAGEGERFDGGRGRPMKEWLALSPTSTSNWEQLAREALDFVSSATG